MTLPSFWAQPQWGHLDRAKHVYCYLANFKHLKLRIRTDEPDFSDILPVLDYNDWKNTAYGEHPEKKTNTLCTLGKCVVLTHYYNTSLVHDILSGNLVTGVLHFYKKTPFDWFCKKQATSKTATYGSKFISYHTCFEHMINHQNYLHYLGVEVCKLDFTFGNNKSKVKSATIPHTKLHKGYNILSFHFVCSINYQKYINLQHICSEFNPSDVLTKHWGYHSIWNNILKSIFHHDKNSVSLFIDNSLVVDQSMTLDNINDIDFSDMFLAWTMGGDKIYIGIHSLWDWVMLKKRTSWSVPTYY